MSTGRKQRDNLVVIERIESDGLFGKPIQQPPAESGNEGAFPHIVIHGDYKVSAGCLLTDTREKTSDTTSSIWIPVDSFQIIDDEDHAAESGEQGEEGSEAFGVGTSRGRFHQ